MFPEKDRVTHERPSIPRAPRVLPERTVRDRLDSSVAQYLADNPMKHHENLAPTGLELLRRGKEPTPRFLVRRLEEVADAYLAENLDRSDKQRIVVNPLDGPLLFEKKHWDGAKYNRELKPAGYTRIRKEIVTRLKNYARAISNIRDHSVLSDPATVELCIKARTFYDEGAAVQHIRRQAKVLAKATGVTTADSLGDVRAYDDYRGERVRQQFAARPLNGLSVFGQDILPEPIVTPSQFPTTSIENQAHRAVRDYLIERALTDGKHSGKRMATIRAMEEARKPPRRRSRLSITPAEPAAAHVGKSGIVELLSKMSEGRAAAFFKNSSPGELISGMFVLDRIGYDIGKARPIELKRQARFANLFLETGVFHEMLGLPKKTPRTKVVKQLGEMPANESRQLFEKAKAANMIRTKIGNRPLKVGLETQDGVRIERYHLDTERVPIIEFNKLLLDDRKRALKLITDSHQDCDLTTVCERLLEDRPKLRECAGLPKRLFLEALATGEFDREIQLAEAVRVDYTPAESALINENGYYFLGVTDCIGEFHKQRQWFKQSGITSEPASKEELAIRMALFGEGVGDDVRANYIEANKRVNSGVLHKMLGQLVIESRVTLHDALLFAPEAKKLSSESLNGVVQGISDSSTLRDFTNLLRRYDPDSDKERDTTIQSLREFKKRVLQIENDIDLSGMPPAMVETLLGAPGLNVIALKTFVKGSSYRALMAGEYDRNQPYEVASETYLYGNRAEAITAGLGTRKEKNGTANNPGKLWHELKNYVEEERENPSSPVHSIAKSARKLAERHNDEALLKLTENEIDEKKFSEVVLKAMMLSKHVPATLEPKITEILQGQGVTIGDEYTATIHAKSDPEGWVCGNYTDCCMPFGSEINNEYMTHPATQYFTVKKNGRIIAQSVLVDSTDRETGQDAVVLDNIEVAHNYKKELGRLSTVYRRFWGTHTNKPVFIGTGYLDLVPTDSELVTNTVQHKHRLVRWSDSTGQSLYKMKPLGNGPQAEEVVFRNIEDRDTPTLLKLEEAAYPPALRLGSSFLSSGVSRARGNGYSSSFLIQKGEEPIGYALTHQRSSARYPGRKEQYIADFAVVDGQRTFGTSMRGMRRILDAAARDKADVVVEARESTTYRLLTSPWAKRNMAAKGFTVKVEGKMEGYLGSGETFYNLRLEPRRGRA